MTNKITILLLSIVLLLSCSNKKKHRNNNNSTEISTGVDNTGKVISIIDGDTYDILIEGNKTIRIRMDGIDAPEKGMPYYKVAKNYLGELCFQKMIKFIKTDDDNHGRVVAKSFLEDERELGQEMIKAGYAWHFKKYSSDTLLANLEIEAQKKKVGLWADLNPISPWEIRKLHRQGVSTKNYFNREK